MDLFEGATMAAGYAADRPPVHAEVMALVASVSGWSAPVGRALDVGCGAGASTRAIQPWARSVVGVDPMPEMVLAATAAVAGAQFAVGSAESLSIASGAVDVIVAAGALNFVDLRRFEAEAARVLRGDGVIAVYDFATGRRSVAAPGVTEAYDGFARRWPRPTSGRQVINPAVLAAVGFSVIHRREVVVTLDLTAAAYVNYVMTETNASAAIGRGEPEDEIRAWCDANFNPVFPVSIPIEFDAWFALLQPSTLRRSSC